MNTPVFRNLTALLSLLRLVDRPVGEKRFLNRGSWTSYFLIIGVVNQEAKYEAQWKSRVVGRTP